MEPLILTHGLRFMPNHFFSGNDLIQISHCPNKRTVPTKVLKKQFTGKGRRCRGYYINRKFHSLTSLERRKYLITKIILKKDNSLPF